jgi:hypothetical protein
MQGANIQYTIRKELLSLLKDDEILQRFILDLVQSGQAGQQRPPDDRIEQILRSQQDWFDHLLTELRHDRETQDQKWVEQNRRWEAQERKWSENQQEQHQRWEAQEQKWSENQAELKSLREEHQRRWEAQERKWSENQQEQHQRWEAQEQKWAENQAELKSLREEHQRHWEAQERKWSENQQEQHQRWEAQEQKWAEQHQRWEAQEQKWAKNQAELKALWQEQNRRWDAQEQKWVKQQEELNRRFDKVHDQIATMADRHEKAVGALGSRWGIYSEESFRLGLKAILEESFGVAVQNYNEFDEAGEVFGRPDQIELDILIHNGRLIICELKSSLSKPDLYTFEKKARFYEKKHGRKADRLITISPMTDPKALKAAELLGIEAYTSSYAAAP